MTFLIAAIASTTLMVSPSLQPLLDEFAAHAEPAEAQQVQAALESSAPLAAQVSGLLDAHRLVAIRRPEAGRHPPGPFGAWQADGVIYLTTQFLFDQANSPHVFDTLDYSKNNPNNLVFSLGHLAYHIQNAASIHACGEHTKLNLAKNDGAPHGPRVELTVSVQSVVQCMLNYEARADIQGWNDMIAAAVHEHRGEALTPEEIADLFMKFRYRYLFCLLHRSFCGFGKWVVTMSHFDGDFEPTKNRWSFRQVESKERWSVSELGGCRSGPPSSPRDSVNTRTMGRFRNCGFMFSWRMICPPRAQT